MPLHGINSFHNQGNQRLPERGSWTRKTNIETMPDSTNLRHQEHNKKRSALRSHNGALVSDYPETDIVLKTLNLLTSSSFFTDLPNLKTQTAKLLPTPRCKNTRSNRFSSRKTDQRKLKNGRAPTHEPTRDENHESRVWHTRSSTNIVESGPP